MSRNPTRLSPPVAGRSPVQKLALDNFARRLHQLMKDKGLSQSDLAREIWGSRTDTRGYEVAKGRDAIHRYLSAQSWPEPQTMAALAKALGVTETELAPEIDLDVVARERPEMSMTSVHGKPGAALLDVYMMVPVSTAARVIAILAGPEGRVPAVAEEPADAAA